MSSKLHRTRFLRRKTLLAHMGLTRLDLVLLKRDAKIARLLEIPWTIYFNALSDKV
jgi:hypothetical protein